MPFDPTPTPRVEALRAILGPWFPHPNWSMYLETKQPQYINVFEKYVGTKRGLRMQREGSLVYKDPELVALSAEEFRAQAKTDVKWSPLMLRMRKASERALGYEGKRVTGRRPLNVGPAVEVDPYTGKRVYIGRQVPPVP
jgi:hypothetical protein